MYYQIALCWVLNGFFYISSLWAATTKQKHNKNTAAYCCCILLTTTAKNLQGSSFIIFQASAVGWPEGLVNAQKFNSSLTTNQLL